MRLPYYLRETYPFAYMCVAAGKVLFSVLVATGFLGLFDLLTNAMGSQEVCHSAKPPLANPSSFRVSSRLIESHSL